MEKIRLNKAYLPQLSHDSEIDLIPSRIRTFSGTMTELFLNQKYLRTKVARRPQIVNVEYLSASEVVKIFDHFVKTGLMERFPFLKKNILGVQSGDSSIPSTAIGVTPLPNSNPIDFDKKPSDIGVFANTYNAGFETVQFYNFSNKTDTLKVDQLLNYLSYIQKKLLSVKIPAMIYFSCAKIKGKTLATEEMFYADLQSNKIPYLVSISILFDGMRRDIMHSILENKNFKTILLNQRKSIKDNTASLKNLNLFRFNIFEHLMYSLGLSRDEVFSIGTQSVNSLNSVSYTGSGLPTETFLTYPPHLILYTLQELDGVLKTIMRKLDYANTEPFQIN